VKNVYALLFILLAALGGRAQTIPTVFFESAGSGPWSSAGTWVGGRVPDASDNVRIRASHTVSLDADGVCASLELAQGSTLSIAANTLVVGTVGGDDSYNLFNGTLNLTGGTLNVNGVIKYLTEGEFRVSGGTLFMDGDGPGGRVGTVFATSGSLLDLSTLVPAKVQFTGGTLRVTDVGGAGTMVRAARETAFGENSTIRLEYANSNNSNPYYLWINTIGNLELEGNDSQNFNMRAWYNNSFANLAPAFTIQGELKIRKGARLIVFIPIVLKKNFYNDSPAFCTILNSCVNLIMQSDQPQTITNLENGQPVVSPTYSSYFALDTLTIDNPAGVTVTGFTQLHGSNFGVLQFKRGKVFTTGSDFMVNRSVVGANADRYVVLQNGSAMLAHQNNCCRPYDITYPVGTPSRYLPVRVVGTEGTINPTSISGAFRVRVNDALTPPTILPSYVQRSWIIDRVAYFFNANNVKKANVTLNWASTDEVNFNRSNAYIARHDGSAWLPLGTSGPTTALGNDRYALTVNDVTDFSPFAVFSSETPTPVELVYFRAEAGEVAVQTTWATAQERNASHFLVERSADLRTFHPVGQVPARGTTSQRQEYALTDAEPLPGTSYYRLRQVDRDGTFELFRPVAVTLGRTEPLLYPNPAAGGTFRVRVAEPATTRFTLLTISGQPVPLQRFDTSDGSVGLRATRTLPPGWYQLRIHEGPRLTTRALAIP
jgi:hypothetical protein